MWPADTCRRAARSTARFIRRTSTTAPASVTVQPTRLRRLGHRATCPPASTTARSAGQLLQSTSTSTRRSKSNKSLRVTEHTKERDLRARSFVCSVASRHLRKLDIRRGDEDTRQDLFEVTTMQMMEPPGPNASESNVALTYRFGRYLLDVARR